jgi:hypothetical protein
MEIASLGQRNQSFSLCLDRLRLGLGCANLLMTQQLSDQVAKQSFPMARIAA